MVIPDQFNFIKWLKTDSVALANDESGRKIVVKENNHAKALSEFSQAVKVYTRVLRTIMPEIYCVDNFIYHTYVEGEMAGDTTDSFGMTKNSFAKINPLVLAQVLYELQNLSNAEFLKTSGIETRNSLWYINNMEETKQAVEQEFDNQYFETIVTHLMKDGRNVNNNSQILVNGDLHPQNLFVNCLLGGEAKNFAISDWDLLQFNNPGYDLADLLTWGWCNPSWCEALLNEAKKLWSQNNVDLEVFVNFSRVYLSCQMIKHIHLMREQNLSEEALVNAMGLLESCKEILKRLVV